MTEWVVLAGGLGSRSLNPNLAKILQLVGEKTILDYLVSALVSANAEHVVFVLRHGKDAVEQVLNAQYRDLPFVWTIVTDEGRGPVSALKAAQPVLTQSAVGVVLGDTLISAPLGFFFNKFVDSGKSYGVVVRQSEHLQDSDVFMVDDVSQVSVYVPKGGSPTVHQRGLNWGATGILFIETNSVAQLNEGSPDLVSSFVEAFGLESGHLLKSSWYHRDTGTPNRLANAINDVRSGLLERNSVTLHKRAGVFFDRDGTLVPDVPEGRKDIQLNDLNQNCVQLIRECRSRGIPVFLITNQPQCAKGFIDIADVYKVHNELQALLVTMNARFDDVVFCPHHPEPGFSGEVEALKIVCMCRKPLRGMADIVAATHNIDLTKSVVVGDSKADSGLAGAVGAAFFEICTQSQAEFIDLLEGQKI